MLKGDALRYHLGMKFSTENQDNDNSDTLHCAKELKSGWWFNDCTDAPPKTRANLNGPYGKKMDNEIRDMVWTTWLHNDTLRHTTMMIRPQGPRKPFVINAATTPSE